MAECRQVEGQRPLGGVTLQAAVGHFQTPAKGGFRARHLAALAPALAAQCEANCALHRPVRLSWAKLLNRVFELDFESCPN